MLLVLIVAGVALLASAFWRWLIIHELSAATGRRVSIDGPVTVHVFSLAPQLSIAGLSVGNPPWAEDNQMLNREEVGCDRERRRHCGVASFKASDGD